MSEVPLEEWILKFLYWVSKKFPLQGICAIFFFVKDLRNPPLLDRFSFSDAISPVDHDFYLFSYYAVILLCFLYILVSLYRWIILFSAMFSVVF